MGLSFLITSFYFTPIFQKHKEEVNEGLGVARTSITVRCKI